MAAEYFEEALRWTKEKGRARNIIVAITAMQNVHKYINIQKW